MLNRIRAERDINKKILISSIFTEISAIVNRVSAAGGVEAISIGSPQLGYETIAAFKPETKNYLVSLASETFLGTYQEIVGEVYKFYPTSCIIGIKRAGGSAVTVFLSEKDFNEIRFLKETRPRFRFKGHPIYKLGVETKSITDFEASEIEYIEPEE